MKNLSARKTRLFGYLSLAAVLACSAGATGALAAASVPDALAPWRDWVLHGQDARLCPQVAGRHAREFCAWPGELRLDARPDGASFDQSWEVLRESAVPLPGSRRHWPREVTVDGRALPVLDRRGVPVVWLGPGAHALRGEIPWPARPQTLNVPEGVALVSLALDGKPVLPLERRGAALSLGGREAAAGAREGDSVDLTIHRKLADGVPATLTTRVSFKVSGKARELSVAEILPAHFVPVRVVSPWMARLDPDGHLRAQAAPGLATVEIEARLAEPLTEVAPVLPPERPQEVWSYQAAPDLRVTTVPPGDGLLAVDPKQAGVPGDWLSLPAFAVGGGARIRVEERSRGQSEAEAQRLTLRREMWLDFSGEGFFARDHIEGEMRRGWRFDVARPYTLERAGSPSPLLVTRGADERLTGVEWREPRVALDAGVRLAAGPSGLLPVTGWQQSFDRVDAVLYLPYAYRLIAAPGADEVSPNVWVERWTILNIFLAAFFTLLAWKRFGRLGGLAAAVYLALAMPEPSAPVFSLATVLVLSLLREAVPAGRLRGLLSAGERIALLCLALMALIFIPVQIRCALYPQLETGGTEIEYVAKTSIVTPEARRESAARMAPPSKPATVMAAPAPSLSTGRIARRSDRNERELMVSGDRVASLVQADASLSRARYAQSTVTQTGGGEPAWRLGNEYHLHWSGPVAEAQNVRLLVSPPWLTRSLRVLMVALLAWLVWRLARLAFPAGASPSAWLKGRAAPSLLASTASGLCLAVLFAASALPAPAAAEPAFPPDPLLERLRERLLEAPKCAPACVDVSDARLDAGARTLRAALTAQVEAAASLALPEPGEYASLRAAEVDGEVRPVLRFQELNYLTLSRGIHQVRLEYDLAGETASLTFPIRPARIEFSGAGWRAEGIDEDRLLGETLNFSLDEKAAAGETPERAAQQFPPFAQVWRHFDFDLDWSVRTEVRRIAPVEGGFTLPVSLLPGEHVTTPEVKVQDGRALAVFAANAGTAAWSARLDRAERVELVAPPLTDRAEIWRVAVSPSWHLEWSGVPATLSGAGQEQAIFEFHPLPGERLTLTLTQPAQIEGHLRAIDRVRLTNRVGQHASEVTLEFGLRASQGGEHAIILPPELEVLDVQRDGARLNLQPREGRLSLPVSPGTQNYVLGLRRQKDIEISSASPSIDLGLPAANVELQTILGERRWILAAAGPTTGPAVLYWGELVVALVVAWLLARSGLPSIRRWECFLLVLGFSTFSWTTLLVVVLWLLVIDWRVRAESCSGWPAVKFDAMQAGIVALTIVMLAMLFSSVSSGLLGVPDMGIAGHESSAGRLRWFADQSAARLPVVQVISLPIWVYRLLMLAWALWLAYVLIRWLNRGLAAWLRHGYWKRIGKRSSRREAKEETSTSA
ncbi:MAG: hypothetical protein LBE85_10610 [Candidatus Accumulibacter sp.]|nr:hypothetical protein [Accumulibacter sp.]